MKEAVIISTARTPIGIAFKGSLNNIKSPSMMGHSIRHAVERAGVDPGMIEDVVIGSVLTAGTAGMNVARLSALAAGLPNSVSGQTIDRQCSSGLIAIGNSCKTDNFGWAESCCCRRSGEHFRRSECLFEMGEP